MKRLDTAENLPDIFYVKAGAGKPTERLLQCSRSAPAMTDSDIVIQTCESPLKVAVGRVVMIKDTAWLRPLAEDLEPADEAFPILENHKLLGIVTFIGRPR